MVTIMIGYSLPEIRNRGNSCSARQEDEQNDPGELPAPHFMNDLQNTSTQSKRSVVWRRSCGLFRQQAFGTLVFGQQYRSRCFCAVCSECLKAMNAEDDRSHGMRQL
jgi:hypothetical protein